MFDWSKSILKCADTMQSAITVLNNESLRIVMIIDSNDCLVGTVTDGDIRRALGKHLPMDTLVSDFMQKNPVTCNEKQNRKEIISMMKYRDILQIPIVDRNNKIVGLETVKSLLEEKKLDNPVFLMAGGFGKRLRPLTNDTPKPLLKVGKKPILETMINKFIDFGFQNFYISTHYKSEMINKYFGNGDKWGVSIEYVHEEKPLGTAGSLGLLPDNLPNLPILIMNGDLLTKVNFRNLLEFHERQKNTSTICVREYDFKVPYGVVMFDDDKISSIVEKPIHKFFVNAGIYVLNRSLIENIDSNSYLDMPNLLNKLVSDNDQNISTYPIHEYWLDIGRMAEYKQAQIDITN
jgi:dTDP-glucose pyrophosphorylase